MNWATITVTKIGAEQGKTNYLFAITGEMRNTDMQYQKVYDNKITLNNAGIASEGTGPVLCECIPFSLCVPDDTYAVYPLDEQGQRMSPVSSTPLKTGNKRVFTLQSPTIWYEIEKQ